jgi:hypothetical protein
MRKFLIVATIINTMSAIINAWLFFFVNHTSISLASCVLSILATMALSTSLITTRNSGN